MRTYFKMLLAAADEIFRNARFGFTLSPISYYYMHTGRNHSRRWVEEPGKTLLSLVNDALPLTRPLRK